MDLWRASEVPAGLRREAASHGWATASPDAFPIVTHRDRDGVPRPTSERDLQVATECAFAIASFLATNAPEAAFHRAFEVTARRVDVAVRHADRAVARQGADRLDPDAHPHEVRAEGLAERVHAPGAARSEPLLEATSLARRSWRRGVSLTSVKTTRASGAFPSSTGARTA